MRKYEFEREARRKAAAAIVENMSISEAADLERMVGMVLERIAIDLCLSENGRALVLEYVKNAVGLSIAEAILQGVETLVGGIGE